MRGAGCCRDPGSGPPEAIMIVAGVVRTVSFIGTAPPNRDMSRILKLYLPTFERMNSVPFRFNFFFSTFHAKTLSELKNELVFNTSHCSLNE